MKPAAVLLGLALVLATPVVAQSPSPRIQVAYAQFTLPNGLQVIIHEDHSVPIVTVNTWYHVGSARERMGRAGSPLLFEHLMFMGSGHMKYGELDAWLEAAGGENNASTGNDFTNYYINAPSKAPQLAPFMR